MRQTTPASRHLRFPLLPRLAAALTLLAALGNAAGATAAATPKRSAPPPTLPAAVALALARADLPPEALAAIVLPAGPRASGGTRPASLRWQHQADRAMVPASTMKLLTSVVALDRLGPNLRGHTELWSQAPVSAEGVLQGDLVLRGGADPELGWPQLSALLAELRWQGIQRIDGDIVLDRLRFNPARADLDQPPFDAWPEFPYNLVPDALQLGGSLMGLEIRADQAGISARPLPPLPGLAIDTSALRLTDRPCREWSADWQSPPELLHTPDGSVQVRLQGGFPRGCVQRAQLQLGDRNLLAERLLHATWQQLGGEWTGQVREAQAPSALPAPAPLPDPLANLLPVRHGRATTTPNPASAPTESSPSDTPAPRLLARRESRPWGELLRPLNKHSDNVLTRLLYMQLGVQLGVQMGQQMGQHTGLKSDRGTAAAPDTPTAALADRAVRQWLAERRIPQAGLVLDNGSGLSRSERISPRTLALALQAAYQGRWAPELLMSLPLAGVDGSLRNRLRDSPAGGWARLKTGSLRDAAALAGYVRDEHGRWWVLVAMINHERAAAGRPALDALVDWIARDGMQPPPRP